MSDDTSSHVRVSHLYDELLFLICYVAHVVGHSFNTAFTNCESVKCIILKFINTF